MENATINSLWIGEIPFGLQQNLTVKSFMSNGYNYRVWTYNPNLIIPQGAEIADANTVVPRDKIFRLKNFNNSLAFFKDYFQSCFFCLHGGIFSDLDVTCLKPLPEYDLEYVFVPHFTRKVGLHGFKVPKSSLFALALRSAYSHFNEHETNYLIGLEIAAKYVEQFGLEKYILDKSKATDDEEYQPRFGETLFNTVQPESMCLVHWMDSQTSHLIQENSSYFRKVANKYLAT